MWDNSIFLFLLLSPPPFRLAVSIVKIWQRYAIDFFCFLSSRQQWSLRDAKLAGPVVDWEYDGKRDLPSHLDSDTLFGLVFRQRDCWIWLSTVQSHGRGRSFLTFRFQHKWSSVHAFTSIHLVCPHYATPWTESLTRGPFDLHSHVRVCKNCLMTTFEMVKLQKLVKLHKQ